MIFSLGSVSFVYLDGFYKYNKINDPNASPVGYRIVSDYRFYVDPPDSTINHFQLHYNKVIRDDGTEYEFYDLRLHYQSFVFSTYYGQLFSGISMDNMYTIYRQRKVQQPKLGKNLDE